ncbi:MAG: hypothetical protein R3E83_11520 [Burkholderiaceae bacterium]
MNNRQTVSTATEQGARARRWLLGGVLVAASAFAVHAPAHAGGRGDQIVGAIIGAGFGAVIGQHIGGQDGAVIGGAIGAATGAAAAGQHGHRVYRTHRPGPQIVHDPYRPPVPAYRPGHAPWVGTLAAPVVGFRHAPVVVPQPVIRVQVPSVVYYPQRPYRHGHVRGSGHGHGSAALARAYRQGVRDGQRGYDPYRR